MLLDSFKLLVAGMGMTFFFLILMIILMTVLHRVTEPFKHLTEPKTAAKPAQAPADDVNIAAAACAFVRARNQ